ncbi:MAG: serine dehydratase subunit alpha family protein [Firmicutes bacterium]|nr:serine dehydratase subunit alpha family protein [Bacillota bacterium]
MERTGVVYKTYVEILKRELVCAMGCTEPIAIAYCAAVARKALGMLPSEIDVAASGNIIKNVKSVIVPNTGGLRGIEAAAAIGALAGDAEADLQVVSHVTPDEIAALPGYMEQTAFSVSAAESEFLLDIEVTVRAGGHFATVRAVQEHTNIVLVETDAGVLFSKDPDEDTGKDEGAPDYTLLNVADICEFADTCELDDVKPVLERQLACNCAIAEEGLRGNYGAGIGKVLLAAYGDDVRTRARAYAAAASDARMNGCDLPVVINSGSGNQGITASLPVYIYAKELGVSEEKLFRAILVSNLVTLHEKTGIGRLSAYCGAVSAGAGAGAGIAYLHGGGCREISHTIVNALAVTSGIVCDGAKSSCAAKIAMAVEAGILGFEMYSCGKQFYGGDGLVAKGVENSIANFSRLGRVGMRETDKEIIRMMTE